MVYCGPSTRIFIFRHQRHVYVRPCDCCISNMAIPSVNDAHIYHHNVMTTSQNIRKIDRYIRCERSSMSVWLVLIGRCHICSFDVELLITSGIFYTRFPFNFFSLDQWQWGGSRIVIHDIENITESGRSLMASYE